MLLCVFVFVRFNPENMGVPAFNVSKHVANITRVARREGANTTDPMSLPHVNVCAHVSLCV